MPTIDTKKSGTVTIRLPASTIKLIEARAYLAEKSVNEVINAIIKRDLDDEIKSR